MAYYRDKEKRGHLTPKEIKFVKGGVVFRYLKLMVFSMRPDELDIKAHYIKKGEGHKVRPRSGDSTNTVATRKSIGATEKTSTASPDKSPRILEKAKTITIEPK